MERGTLRKAFAIDAVLLKDPKFLRRAVERTTLRDTKHSKLQKTSSHRDFFRRSWTSVTVEYIVLEATSSLSASKVLR
jgi:hypothetical protein